MVYLNIPTRLIYLTADICPVIIGLISLLKSQVTISWLNTLHKRASSSGEYIFPCFFLFTICGRSLKTGNGFLLPLNTFFEVDLIKSSDLLPGPSIKRKRQVRIWA